MRQLSKNDALFLATESAHSNSNVSLITIYDPSTVPGGRLSFKSILALVESRLHRSPVFRQKLRTVPFGLDEPYWIEDENFDLEYHVRNVALPRPGDWRQFCIQTSRIHARPLDLNRPLWELYVIEGLDSLLDLPKDSFALLTKLHHSAIDMRRGTAIITLLHDTTAQPSPQEPPEPWFPESSPSSLELVTRGLMHAVTSPKRLVRPISSVLASVAPAARSFAADLLQKHEGPPVTRFNSAVSPYRVFETRRFLLSEFREIRRLVPGAKINDVVLAVCAGALRKYLEGNDELPEQDLSTLTPVYVRDPEAGPESRPEVAWERVMLGVDIADARKRLAFIKGQTASSSLISTRDRRTRAHRHRNAGAGRHARHHRQAARPRAARGRPARADRQLRDHQRAGPFGPALPRRSAHDVLLRDHADQRRPRPRVRGDELRRQDHRFAHLVPRADAGPGGLRAVPARRLPGVPRARAPARAGQGGGPAEG